MFSNLWSDLKAWFKNSEIIFWSRLQVAVGFILAALASIDWTQLANYGVGEAFSFNQTVWLSLGLVANGLWQEYLRRRNANL